MAMETNIATEKMITIGGEPALIKVRKTKHTEFAFFLGDYRGYIFWPFPHPPPPRVRGNFLYKLKNMEEFEGHEKRKK